MVFITVFNMFKGSDYLGPSYYKKVHMEETLFVTCVNYLLNNIFDSDTNNSVIIGFIIYTPDFGSKVLLVTW